MTQMQHTDKIRSRKFIKHVQRVMWHILHCLSNNRPILLDVNVCFNQSVAVCSKYVFLVKSISPIIVILQTDGEKKTQAQTEEHASSINHQLQPGLPCDLVRLHCSSPFTSKPGKTFLFRVHTFPCKAVKATTLCLGAQNWVKLPNRHVFMSLALCTAAHQGWNRLGPFPRDCQNEKCDLLLKSVFALLQSPVVTPSEAWDYATYSKWD